jgi:integrase
LALSPALIARLRKRRHAQQVEAVETGQGWSDERLVFASATSRMLHASTFCDALGDTCARLAIPYIGVHGSRHTGGSIAYAAGMPVKAISERLGHSDIAITLRIYTHLDKEQRQGLADAMGELLG